MKKKKKTLLAICCMLFFVIALREFGLLDTNLYFSKINSYSTSALSGINDDNNNDEQLSYELIIKYKDKDVYHQSHNFKNLDPIKIIAVIEEPEYSDNYYIPFIKSFKMAYLCNFSTSPSQTIHNIEGSIEGKVDANIHGFCSWKKAKNLAFEEALKTVSSSLEKQLRNRTIKLG